ncbi:fibronectin type III domain-containing protein [uncultured Muribaculum sp.]|uniref:fibronectin type III domain-containing protein n=1 Tax=uncultured Muribaculum sp. TaxID=1918613 RepID=UPI0025EE24AA|nr:fibronectin type III domain-containing protein [uncultured Muribaculum sp.]
MKKLINIMMSAIMLAALTGCWDDEVVDAGAARPQVENLKAVPGDEEAVVTWSMPQGWNPTDFIISYKTPESETVSFRTGKLSEYTYTIGSLVNDYQYSLDIQAVYGNLISGAVTAIAKPSTSRFPVTDLVALGDNASVTLTWTRPSMLVKGYTLTYFADNAPADTKRMDLAPDAETVTVDNLTNDINYTFTLTASYDRGDSEPAIAKAMPTLAIPYFVSTENTAIGMPVHFTFNREAYADAANVTWTFPGDIVKSGDEVDYAFTSSGDHTVKLSAQIGTVKREWSIGINVREYAVSWDAWVQDGSNWNGFKGTCPVFSPDGRMLYIITFNKITALYAFDTMSGEKKWEYIPAAKSGSYNMLTVNPVNGDIYFGTQTAGQFYCVSPEGQLRWTFTEAQSMQAAAPAVNAAGTIVYIGDRAGNVFAIDTASGSKKWGVSLGTQCAGLLVNGSEIVVGTNGTTIFFLNSDTGAEVAKLTIGKKMTDISGFAVAADKRSVYVPQNNGCMSKIDIIDHTVLIDSKICTSASPNNMYEPVVAPNGDVFVGSKDSYAYCFDSELNEKWNYKGLDGNNAFNYSHPCVDTEGNFYITSGQKGNKLFVFSPTGGVISDSRIGSDADGADKQMGGNNLLNGVVYSALVGDKGVNGKLVGIGFGYDRAPGWSTHGGDPCGSCCIK